MVPVAFAPSSSDSDLELEPEEQSNTILPAATKSPPDAKVTDEPSKVTPADEPVICLGDISDFQADVQDGE